MSTDAALWQKFDPAAYVADNYETVADEDAAIVRLLAGEYPALEGASGVDVGTGANLYPPLMAAAFCKQLDMVEISEPNLIYLHDQLYRLDQVWLNFWRLIKQAEPRVDGQDPVAVLKNRTLPVKGSIYELPERHYDFAQMFFCAESIDEREEAFLSACRRFERCVKPGGRLIAGFIENSTGYTVDGHPFPAFPLAGPEALPFAHLPNFSVRRIPASGALREGISGILIMTANGDDDG